MAKKQDKKEHAFARKAFAVLMAVLLLAVLGRMVIGAVSFISENADRPVEIDGPTFTITGEGCTLEQDTADCCEDACLKWCIAKGAEVWKAGVIDPIDTKCECMCSPDFTE